MSGERSPPLINRQEGQQQSSVSFQELLLNIFHKHISSHVFHVTAVMFSHIRVPKRALLGGRSFPLGHCIRVLRLLYQMTTNSVT